MSFIGYIGSLYLTATWHFYLAVLIYFKISISKLSSCLQTCFFSTVPICEYSTDTARNMKIIFNSLLIILLLPGPLQLITKADLFCYLNLSQIWPHLFIPSTTTLESGQHLPATSHPESNQTSPLICPPHYS